MQIALTIPETISEGPGKRFALWVQGCPFRCPGCCNQSFLPFEGGITKSVKEILEEIRVSKEKYDLEGVSLLGGEPLAQLEEMVYLVQGIRKLGLTIMVYSGYTLEELKEKGDPNIDYILNSIDLLVDGRFNWKLLEKNRRWIGSSNQILHFLSKAYSPNDPRFRAKNTVEFRILDNKLVINGWPEKGLPT